MFRSGELWRKPALTWKAPAPGGGARGPEGISTGADRGCVSAADCGTRLPLAGSVAATIRASGTVRLPRSAVSPARCGP
ncbi:hypothetical protein E1202_01890 [Saccharopolyspora karakumensis]|uniref:Uncharacterized protein n=1 Tax=Saccharopolyspora karakumensis TaxID=2530386 RepID=A0A4V2YYD6_9PSEU|nr:hypothetical protein E1202_01890 [Saccharopolyspora karakumensis]